MNADMTTIATLQSVADALSPWSSLYSDSTPVAVAVVFVHLAALLIGGGFAVAADRNTLRAFRSSPEARKSQLAELHATHRPVLTALGFSFTSGLLLAAADLEHFVESPVFWGKLGCVGLLIINGAILTRTETMLRGEQAESINTVRLWKRLRISSIVSLLLWTTTVFFGTLLVNAS